MSYCSWETCVKIQPKMILTDSEISWNMHWIHDNCKNVVFFNTRMPIEKVLITLFIPLKSIEEKSVSTFYTNNNKSQASLHFDSLVTPFDSNQNSNKLCKNQLHKHTHTQLLQLNKKGLNSTPNTSTTWKSYKKNSSSRFLKLQPISTFYFL